MEFIEGIRIEDIIHSKEIEQAEEKWIWVEGYKATDRNMVCHNYQYLMGEVHEHPAGDDILLCNRGFHFCKHLSDVFYYYDLEDSNRFFKVMAHVRRKDWEDTTVNKYVSKSIIFTEELKPETVVSSYSSLLNSVDRVTMDVESWTEEQYKRCLEIGIHRTWNEIRMEKLTSLGYSKAFAAHILRLDGYETAVAVGSQPELSMDMKVMAIYESAWMAVSYKYEDKRRPMKRPTYRF